MVRVAVAVPLQNPGSRPWMLRGAALVVKGQEGRDVVPWASGPIDPGPEWLEMDLTKQEVRSTYLLEL